MKNDKSADKSSESNTRKFFSSRFDFRGWIDWDRVNNGKNYVVDIIKPFVVPSPSKSAESFEEVQARMKLTDDDLTLRRQALLRIATLYLLVGIFLFLYVIYLALLGSIKSSIYAFVLDILSLVMAFRYHFWYYQIKSRKLGVSIKEWFSLGVWGKKT